MKHAEPPENLPIVPDEPVVVPPIETDEQLEKDVHCPDPKTGDTVCPGQTAEPRERAPASHARRSLQSMASIMTGRSSLDTSALAPDDMLEVRDVADRLRVSRAAVYRWKQQRRLPYYSLPGGIRFKVSDVDVFVESWRTESRPRHQYGRTQDQR